MKWVAQVHLRRDSAPRYGQPPRTVLGPACYLVAVSEKLVTWKFSFLPPVEQISQP